MKRVVMLLALASLLTGCGLSVAPPLDGTEWLSMERTDGGADWPLVAGTRIRLTFSGGQVGATAGCNSIGGTYRIENGTLVFEGGGMTEMGCDDERHAQDDWLAAFLASRPAVRVEGSDLALTSGDELLVLRDREVADPDQPLTGTTWTVETLFDGDTASSVPAGAVATVAFEPDGTVKLAAGCNEGTARYERVDGRLTIDDVILTDMACDGPPAQLEAIVLGVLTGDDLTVSIEAGSLVLMSGDQGLGLRAS